MSDWNEFVRLKEANILVKLDVDPIVIKVFNEEGKIIGAANVLGWENDGIKLHLILDPHNPEVFDLDVEPRRVGANVRFVVENNVLVDGVVVLNSK